MRHYGCDTTPVERGALSKYAIPDRFLLVKRIGRAPLSCARFATASAA